MHLKTFFFQNILKYLKIRKSSPSAFYLFSYNGQTDVKVAVMVHMFTKVLNIPRIFHYTSIYICIPLNYRLLQIPKPGSILPCFR